MTSLRSLAIQGPPGAGKTFTDSRVIKELVEKHHWRIGVVAQSHAAVENMLASTVKASTAPDLMGKAGTKSSLPSWTLIWEEPGKRHGSWTTTSIPVASLAALHGPFANAARITRESLDLLVVDEAGQFALAPTISASVAAKRLLLLGDPQQLPQVSQGTDAEPVNESALGWLMDGHHHPWRVRLLLGQDVPHAPRPVRQSVDLVVRRAADLGCPGVRADARRCIASHSGHRTGSQRQPDRVA